MTMAVPIELIIAFGTALMAFLSFCVHLLMKLNTTLSAMDKRSAVHETRQQEKNEALTRHMERNAREIESLQTFLSNQQRRITP